MKSNLIKTLAIVAGVITALVIVFQIIRTYGIEIGGAYIGATIGIVGLAAILIKSAIMRGRAVGDIFDKGISFWLALAALVSGFFTGALWFALMPSFVPIYLKWVISGATGIVTSIAYIQNERREKPSRPARYVFKFTTIAGALLISYSGINALKMQAKVRNIDIATYETSSQMAAGNLEKGYLTATRKQLEAAREKISTEANVYDFFDFMSVRFGIGSEWFILLFAAILAASLDNALDVLATAKIRIFGKTPAENSGGKSGGKSGGYVKKNGGKNGGKPCEITAESDDSECENQAQRPELLADVSPATARKILNKLRNPPPDCLTSGKRIINKKIAEKCGCSARQVGRVRKAYGL